MQRSRSFTRNDGRRFLADGKPKPRCIRFVAFTARQRVYRRHIGRVFAMHFDERLGVLANILFGQAGHGIFLQSRI